MLFSTTLKDILIERMMTSFPYFPEKVHGTYVFDKSKYTVKDCDCMLCPHFSRKKKCRIPECECIEKRIAADMVDYLELFKHTFAPVKNNIFQKRLTQYLMSISKNGHSESEMNPMLYRGNSHKEMFEKAIEQSLNIDNAMLSALYLLTADKYLWSKVGHSVSGKSVNFSAVRLGNINTDAYTLYMTARDLYSGTKHITLSDIADTELISNKMFGILCNAMAIRRYGMKAVAIVKKEGEKKY